MTVRPIGDPFRPISAKASAAVPEHGASALHDALANTYWQSPPDPVNKGAGSSFLIRFGREVTVSDLIVTPGLPEKDGLFASQPSVAQLGLRWLDERGKAIATDDVRFDSFAAPQPAVLPAPRSNVTSVRVTVLAVNPNTGGGTELAITKIEFFGDPGKSPGLSTAVPVDTDLFPDGPTSTASDWSTTQPPATAAVPAP